MRNLLLIVLIFLIGCSQQPQKTPKYRNFDTAWENDKLFGKVEELTQFKVNFTNFQNTETPTPVFRKHYTEFGKILFYEHYNNFGDLDQAYKNEFDENHNVTVSYSENTVIPSKSVETSEYDNKGNRVSTKVVFNDSLELVGKFKYDSLNNITHHLEIQNSDTSVVKLKYSYDKNGNILQKKQISQDQNGSYEYFNEFKYDNKGNLIETSTKSEITGSMKVVYEYDNSNRIIKETEYRDGQIQKETTFDKLFNPISVKYFERSALTKEMQYRKYKFDENDNWVSRQAYLKEYFGESKKFQPIFIETREIEYY